MDRVLLSVHICIKILIYIKLVCEPTRNKNKYIGISQEDEETKKDKKKPKHMTQLFKELTNSFSDGLRITADSMDIGPLVQVNICC